MGTWVELVTETQKKTKWVNCKLNIAPRGPESTITICNKFSYNEETDWISSLHLHDQKREFNFFLIHENFFCYYSPFAKFRFELSFSFLFSFVIWNESELKSSKKIDTLSHGTYKIFKLLLLFCVM